MSTTFTFLKHGDRRIMDAYRIANMLWDDIFHKYEGDFSYLARELNSVQITFEWKLASLNLERWEAQEIMVFSGLSFFLDQDDDESRYLASTVSEAFEMSFCSIEVKSLAKRVSALFYLDRGYYG
ncbi:hypothetical protein [Vibrio parahaemolyticus]|uniref:hypothetical protein n=1 Tax=Vibrio parahaemolyticus TaxID=670 RepID=UPI002361013A|nr:hypothetical protein [Vibrio parahaemolyticus]WLI84470.1 hypothetical protein Q7W79_16435 [Vibrio parahaemolyticus]